MAASFRERADKIAADNPPHKVLDNIVVALAIAIGWTSGHIAKWAWKYPVAYLVILWLSVEHGYKLANPKVVEPPQPHPQSQSAIYAAGNVVAYRDPE